MVDKAASDSVRRARAGRIQQIVDTRSPSSTAFYRGLSDAGLDHLVSTIRGWVLPPRKWRWDKQSQDWIPKLSPRTGRQLSKAEQLSDLEALRTPSGKALSEFCKYTGAKPEFVLTGEGPSYEGQERSPATLEADMAAAVRRRVIELCKDTKIEIDPSDADEWGEKSQWLLAHRFIDELALRVFEELLSWTKFFDATDAVMELATVSARIDDGDERSMSAILLAASFIERSRPDTRLVAGLSPAELAGEDTDTETGTFPTLKIPRPEVNEDDEAFDNYRNVLKEAMEAISTIESQAEAVSL